MTATIWTIMPERNSHTYNLCFKSSNKRFYICSSRNYPLNLKVKALICIIFSSTDIAFQFRADKTNEKMRVNLHINGAKHASDQRIHTDRNIKLPIHCDESLDLSYSTKLHYLKYAYQ